MGDRLRSIDPSRRLILNGQSLQVGSAGQYRSLSASVNLPVEGAVGLFPESVKNRGQGCSHLNVGDKLGYLPCSADKMGRISFSRWKVFRNGKIMVLTILPRTIYLMATGGLPGNLWWQDVRGVLLSTVPSRIILSPGIEARWRGLLVRHPGRRKEDFAELSSAAGLCERKVNARGPAGGDPRRHAQISCWWQPLKLIQGDPENWLRYLVSNHNFIQVSSGASRKTPKKTRNSPRRCNRRACLPPHASGRPSGQELSQMEGSSHRLRVIIPKSSAGKVVLHSVIVVVQRQQAVHGCGSGGCT